jgi:hypothetical protein
MMNKTDGTTVGFMARNQYGETIHLPHCTHPRKALLAHLGRQHASKMYCDTLTGESKHIGYVIAGQWLTIYRVNEWEG